MLRRLLHRLAHLLRLNRQTDVIRLDHRNRPKGFGSRCEGCGQVTWSE